MRIVQTTDHAHELLTGFYFKYFGFAGPRRCIPLKVKLIRCGFSAFCFTFSQILDLLSCDRLTVVHINFFCT